VSQIAKRLDTGAIEGLHLLDVRPGNKSLAFTGHNQHADSCGLDSAGKELSELLKQSPIKSVQGFWAINR
jgi:hypothetical protein